MQRHVRSRLMGAAAALVLSGAAQAADPEECNTVRFSDVGWTDITATTAAATVVLQGLGYAPDTQVLSVPVTYASMKNKDIDVFLGNWMPTMEADIPRNSGTTIEKEPDDATGRFPRLSKTGC